MFGQFTTNAIIAFTFMLVLAACTGPALIILSVVNSIDTGVEGGGSETYCSDSLRATLTWGEQQVEVAALPGEGLDKDLYTGSGDVTIEAWCYREGSEVGYVQLRRGVGSAPVPDVIVIPPGESGELLDDTYCETPDTSRGVPLCVFSDLF